MSRPAVFLDRDGTLLEGTGYHADPEAVRPILGVPEALAALKAARFALVVLTNQSGVARGLFTCADVEATHRRADLLLGGKVDRWYYCPHHPEIGAPPWRAACTCRKPAAGLLERAVRELDLSLEGSFAVGDQLRDLDLFASTPVRKILVLTGLGARVLPRASGRAIDHVAPDLTAAAAWILDGARGGGLPPVIPGGTS